MSGSEPTFIVTAELDGESFGWLDGLRQRHFPPERNFLNAHLTLFHKMGEGSIEIVRQTVAANAVETMGLRFSGLRMLGRGVAIEVVADELAALRSACAEALGGRLSAQDRQSFRPHVTIQNKVDPHTAKELHAEMQKGFVERTGATRALLIWRYLGGPWEFSERLCFGHKMPAADI